MKISEAKFAFKIGEAEIERSDILRFNYIEYPNLKK